MLRPKCPVNLTNIGLVALLEAIYTTTKVDQAQAEQADQVRVHPIKNTITISTPDKARANAYRALELLRSEEYSIDMPVSAYVPAPDGSIRGLVCKAYTNETDHDINEEISRKNPQLPIVSARRLGYSRHFVITFAGKDLPSSIRYRCFNLNVYPFRDRSEACFNCRKLGHRTDVCPQPRPPTPRCRRCGEQHSPPPEGEKPTCVPLCVVCHGQHPTGSRSCKRRFIQPKETKRTWMTSINITGDTRRSRSRERTQADFRDRSESFPRLQSRELDKTISGGHNSQHDEPAKHVAWGSGKPHHRESTVLQVTAPLETPSEQKPRNARVLTHTREERSGFKTSQAVREEGSQARHQQSKPQQQQQDPQVRELAEQIKFLKQQLAAANDKIRQLENKSCPNSNSHNLSINGSVVCAPSEAENMETDNTQGEKRKAASPVGDKKSKREGLDSRVAEVEIAIEKILNNIGNLTAQIQQQCESIAKLSTAVQALTNHTGLAMARKPPATPSQPSGDNVSSEASTSDTRQPAGGPIRSHSAGSARVEPHKRS